MKLVLSLLLCIAVVSGMQAKPAKPDARVETLLHTMTVEEKIAQMTQVDYTAIQNNAGDIVKYSLGSILWGGSSEIKDITAKGWAAVYDSLQRLTEKTRLITFR